MNDNAKKWLEALRSDEYSQGMSYLCYEDRYSCKEFHCCLGVACELYMKENPKAIQKVYTHDQAHVDGSISKDAVVNLFKTSTETRSGSLPDIVAMWLGLKDSAGTPVTGSNYASLTTLNDTGSTFKEIADTLEKNERYYFNV